MAITWKDVAGATTGASAMLINQGANNMQNAMQGFADMAEQGRQQNISNQNSLEDENTQAIAEQLKQFGTVEELDSAVASGKVGLKAFDNLFGKGNYDSAKALSLIDNRDNAIMQDENDRFQYGETKRKQNDAPLMAKFQSRLNNAGSSKEVKDILADLTTSGISEQGQTTLTSSARSLERDLYSFNKTKRDDYRNEQAFQASEDLKDLFQRAVTEPNTAREAYTTKAKEHNIALNPDGTIKPYEADAKTIQSYADFLGKPIDSAEVQAYTANQEDLVTESWAKVLEKEAGLLAEAAKTTSEFDKLLYSRIGKDGYNFKDLEAMSSQYRQYQTNLQALPSEIQERVSSQIDQFNAEADVISQGDQKRIEQLDAKYSTLANMEVKDLEMSASDGMRYMKENILKNFKDSDDLDLEDVLDEAGSQISNIKNITGAEIKAITDAISINPAAWGFDAELSEPAQVAKIVAEARNYKSNNEKEIEAYLTQKANLQQLLLNREKDKVANANKLTNEAKLRHTALAKTLY